MSIWDTITTTEDLDERQKAGEVPFIGQPHIRSQVEPFINSEFMPHILLAGDPGIGKTQFARWVAWRRGRPFFERMAPAQLSSLPPYGVMLLDEAHRQTNPESLFSTMDKGVLTFIAATTKPDKLDSAFRSRFVLSLRLSLYTIDEMKKIILLMSDLEEMDDGHREVLANAAAGNPRTAKKIMLTAEALGTFDPAEVLKAARITADGLTDDHFDYLKALYSSIKPMGLIELSSQTSQSDDRIRVVERLLAKDGLIALTASGRALTLRGRQYVDMLTNLIRE